MALDGLVVHSLSHELHTKLVGGKVDKVHQPENDELVLYIRNNKESFKLVLSSSASNPRVYIANDYKKENPIKAPMFCMLFRKYIQGGNIVNVSQVDFERIIKISVESFDELKEKTTKDIIIEIMGRHSNIILTHSSNNKIIDSAKRILEVLESTILICLTIGLRNSSIVFVLVKDKTHLYKKMYRCNLIVVR